MDNSNHNSNSFQRSSSPYSALSRALASREVQQQQEQAWDEIRARSQAHRVMIERTNTLAAMSEDERNAALQAEQAAYAAAQAAAQRADLLARWAEYVAQRPYGNFKRNGEMVRIEYDPNTPEPWFG